MVLCAGREGFLEVSEMNFFKFGAEKTENIFDIFARADVLEVLQKRVAALESQAAIMDGMTMGLLDRIRNNEDKEKLESEEKKAARAERQRTYARKYYAENSEKIKAKKREKLISDKQHLVNPDQMELPEIKP